MNKFIGIGRITKDPDVKVSQGGNKVARYTLAIDRRHSKEKETDFLPCVAFGRSAEFAEKYLYKGIKIAVTGRIQTGSYTNKDGVKVYTTDVIVEDQEFAESKNAQETTPSTPSTPQQTAMPDFMDITDEELGELPFH